MEKTIEHVPPPVEFSRFLAFEWDIAKMQAYIAQRGIPPSKATVSFAAMEGFFGGEGGIQHTDKDGETTVIHIGMFSIDEKRAMTDEIDPAIPIILADVTGRDGTVIGRVPIDGRHRMYKAWKTATADPVVIPFHFMSGPEELQFRTERSMKPDPPKKPRKPRRKKAA